MADRKQSYSQFSLEKARDDFGLTTDLTKNLFARVPEVTPSPFLRDLLRQFVPLGVAIGTEKSRSEFIVAPILAEIRKLAHEQVSLFSGINFKVDAKRGLTGVCDFIFSLSTEQLVLTAPAVVLVEAKKDDLMGGLGQCVAEMVAAQIFNERKQQPLKAIYGAVTTGTAWRFLKLEGAVVYVDQPEYFIWQSEDQVGGQVGKILGILLQMLKVERPKQKAKAKSKKAAK
jgi:hypothetical protein